MSATDGMETYAARLASFNIIHSTNKKRTSTAKNAKLLKWTHKTPSPSQLAEAGFYYRPTASCPDNATCFYCHKGLDGWEEDDDPIAEHLKHSPDCGWAINAGIEQGVEAGIKPEEDPASERVLAARKMTFGEIWPHEGKRGWICQVRKMVEAGWYYCPTPESDDFVKCPYCSLSLDGWEPKDNPYDEHQRRSPECTFFVLTSEIPPKQKRVRKGSVSTASRTSRISRMSTQSVVAAALDDISPETLKVDGNLKSAVEPANTSSSIAVSKASKKAKPTKNVKNKSKAKALKTDEVEAAVGSSFIEPEDDDFEVKVQPTLVSNGRSKKRNSQEMDIDDPVAQNNSEPAESVEPPLKRRNTRAKSSLAHVSIQPTSKPTDEEAIDLANIESAEKPAQATAQGAKGRKKRATSKARKASNISTASKASLRAASPAEDEIDAALQADLDRPLTDDEDVVDPEVEEEKPKKRRITRNRPMAKKISGASVAPVRKNTRASAMSVNDPDHIQVPNADLGTKPRSEIIATTGEKSEQALERSRSEKVAKTHPKGSKNTVKRSKTQSKGAQVKAKLSSASVGSHQQDQGDSEMIETIAPPLIVPSPSSVVESVHSGHPAEVSSPLVSTFETAEQVASPIPSSQNSDVENQPPSSRPSSQRPPLEDLTPSKAQTILVPLAPSTPKTSPSRRNVSSRLQTTCGWTAVDLDSIFATSPPIEGKENIVIGGFTAKAEINDLTSPEKRMTVEDWIHYQARQAEQKLRNQCESLVGSFEDQGVKALKALEGLVDH